MRTLILTVAAAAVYFIPSPVPAQSSTAQTAQYAALALSLDGGEPLACGTPALFSHQLLSGFAPAGSIRMANAETPDGQPLWYDQNPRLLHAEHTGGLALDNFLVAGDVETLSFERWSASVQETWQRVRTTAIDGRLNQRLQPKVGRCRVVGHHPCEHAGIQSPVRLLRVGDDPVTRRCRGRGLRDSAELGAAERAAGPGDAHRRQHPVREPRRQPRHPRFR